MRRAVAWSLAWLSALAVLTAGCALGGRGAQDRYDNAAALASTLHRPAGGTAEERTYRNGRYRRATFAGVLVLPPSVEARSREDPEYEAFLQDVRHSLESGTVQALTSVRRLGPVDSSVPPGPGVLLLCETEALVHVTPTGHTVERDPVFRDPRPKLIVVYRLADAATGELVFQYTGVGTSHWEYGPWAMEDLRGRALEIAGELRDVLMRE
ncbi:MAG: hypothetical protein SCH98_09890 [Deferrisomatales bacterium]|nr:hypothetical protein [Deferrisomatales bacterium]